MINYILLVIYIWVSGWVGGCIYLYISVYPFIHTYIYTSFFLNLIVKCIETFVVCAVSRIKLLLLISWLWDGGALSPPLPTGSRIRRYKILPIFLKKGLECLQEITYNIYCSRLRKSMYWSTSPEVNNRQDNWEPQEHVSYSWTTSDYSYRQWATVCKSKRKKKFKSLQKKSVLTTEEEVTPLWPQANGEVERQNRSLLKRIKIAQIIESFLIMHRTTPHSITGVGPAELLFQRKLWTRIPGIEEFQVDDQEVFYNDCKILARSLANFYCQ